jgi:hypothetical protein
MKAIDLLEQAPTSWLNRDPNSNFGKYFNLYSKSSERLDEVLESFKDLFRPELQSGFNLDRLGQLVREPRQGLSDDRYRIFISIGIEKYLSNGSLYSLNQIGQRLVEGQGNLFEIKELCYNEEPQLLDGSLLLNGEWPLSGSQARPATIEIIFTGSPSKLNIYSEFNKAIKQVKAGGISSIINYRFELKYSEGVVTYNRSLLLDGEWFLDGATYLDGDKLVFAPEFIALGDGADLGSSIRVPEASDTTLQNEIIRKSITVNQLQFPREFSIQIKPGEIVNSNINELGLFTSDGILLLAVSFPNKFKDSLSTLSFTIMEEII